MVQSYCMQYDGCENAGIFIHAITNHDVHLCSCAVGGVVKWEGLHVDFYQFQSSTQSV